MKRSIKSIIFVLLLILVIVFSIFLYLNWKNDSSISDGKSDVVGTNDDTKIDSKDDDNSIDKNIDDDNSSNSDDLSSNNSLGNSNSNSQNYSKDNKQNSVISPNTNVDTNRIETSSNYVPVTSFAISLTSTTLSIGESVDVGVSISPSNATDKNISYVSSDSSIAVISRTGLVTGVRVGETYISVTVNDSQTRVVKITVVDRKSSVSTSGSSYNKSFEVEYSNPINGENFSDNGSNSSTNNNSNSSTNNSSVNSSTNNNSGSNNSVINKDRNNNTSSSTSNSSSSNSSNNTSDNAGTSYNKPSVVKKKNGWYVVNKKRYYYKDGELLKDTYVEYIYLDKNGVAQEKVGSFSATLYGAVAWANQNINIRQQANKNSKKLGTIPTGARMTILSDDNKTTKYIKVKYNNIEGYVYSDYIFINLPDIMPDMVYEITNADNSIFKTADTSIPNVTGKGLYGYTKKLNKKIGKTTYYAPLLYPVAKQLQKAYDIAKSDGYNIKIYDTYRPYDVSVSINKDFRKLYNSNKTVYNMINYDKNGNYWGPGWFLANGSSGHNRGTDMDITLTDKNNKELSAQTPMHTLDARSIVRYNNSVSNKLREIMTSVGFETLKSEWWHFQENNYRSSPINSFRLQ